MADYITDTTEESRRELHEEFSKAYEEFRKPWFYWILGAGLSVAFWLDLRVGLGVGVFVIVEALRDILRELRLGNLRQVHTRITVDEINMRVRSIQRVANPESFTRTGGETSG